MNQSLLGACQKLDLGDSGRMHDIAGVGSLPTIEQTAEASFAKVGLRKLLML